MKKLILLAAAAALASGCTDSREICDAALPVAGEAWARATAEGQANGAVYLTVRSNGNCAFELEGASSPVAAMSSLHETYVEDGLAGMREAGTVEIPANGEVNFEPGGLHVMLMGLEAPLEAGTTFPMTLDFGGDKRLQLDVAVVEVSAR